MVKLCQVYSFRRSTSKVAHQSSQLGISVAQVIIFRGHSFKAQIFCNLGFLHLTLSNVSSHALPHNVGGCCVGEPDHNIVCVQPSFAIIFGSLLFHISISRPKQLGEYLSVADVWIKLTTKLPRALIHLVAKV